MTKLQHDALTKREQWADDVLEGAGKWGSGKPLVELLGLVWASLVYYKERVRFVPKTDDWTHQMSEELLEGAGLSLSGEPFWSTIVTVWTRIWLTSLADFHERHVSPRHSGVVRDLSAFTNDLSTDIQLHVFSFLHPKDITTFACCSKESKAMVSCKDHIICKHLWKALWDRDFAWLIESLDVGAASYRRSHCRERPVDQQLYFEFAETYVNYIIAGHNSITSCLVGLHGNIYDMSNFLRIHPGSPETIQSHAGRDATGFFEAIGHSMAARKRAVPMCVVVDLSYHDANGFGVRRASDVPEIEWVIPFGRYSRRPSTLFRVRKHLDKGKRQAQQGFKHMMPFTILEEANVFYDPFDRKWKAWSIDLLLENHFVSD